jgi:hypothetical protein
VRIRALSVFEGVVYHCWAVDSTAPARPTLEVEALLRPGDADAEAGPLLLSVADYIVMVGGLAPPRPGLVELAAAGRIVEHLGVDHIAFPTWTPVEPEGLAGTDDTSVTDPGDATPPAPSLRVVREDSD